MTERRDIGSRLENWARVYRDTARQGTSPTGAFCDQLRIQAEGEKPVERRRVDEEDARRIEVGMRQIEAKHRLMLWWCYMQQADPNKVCRVLQIPHRPSSVFVGLFRAAQAAIESVVEKNMERMG